jgi:eukaryotic-like serine/threonine-protein kinase
VLPVSFAREPDRIARFEREARAASALNHPNIVSVYDIGRENSTYWIVSELVDGETLRKTIDHGPLPARKAIEIAVQIAEGLAAAHAGGIVHRDLKPGNIMFARNGRVKILDFGLAKQEQLATDSSTRELTNEGTILGTAGYMSPEQVRGEDVDYRSDIFSFGVILYEMLAGKQAFSGRSSIEVMNAILKDDPPELRPSVPPALERIVRRCLEKEPGRRFQSAADLGFALPSVSASQPRPGAAGKNLAWLTWGIVVLIAAAGLWLRFLRPATSPELAPRTVPLASYPGNQCCPSFSPDGSQVAFVWDGPKQDNLDIYIKLVGTEHTVRLTNDPAPDVTPAWSPDGRYIAFLRLLSENRVGVFLVSAIGGPERKLTELSGETGGNGGVAWHPEGKWLAFTDQNSIYLISIDTGEKRKLTFPTSGRSDDCPAFSSDGRRLAFSRNFTFGVSEMYLLALSQNLGPQGEAKQLTFKRQSSKCPVWTPNGREIIFSSGPGIFGT